MMNTKKVLVPEEGKGYAFSIQTENPIVIVAHTYDSLRLRVKDDIYRIKLQIRKLEKPRYSERERKKVKQIRGTAYQNYLNRLNQMFGSYPSNCPECGSDKIIKDPKTEELICSDCGLILRESIDMGPEWRAYTPEEKLTRSRVGPYERIGRQSLGSEIDIRDILRVARKKKQPWGVRLSNVQDTDTYEYYEYEEEVET